MCVFMSVPMRQAFLSLTAGVADWSRDLSSLDHAAEKIPLGNRVMK